jgi:hypothetical protein
MTVHNSLDCFRPNQNWQEKLVTMADMKGKLGRDSGYIGGVVRRVHELELPGVQAGEFEGVTSSCQCQYRQATRLHVSVVIAH